jgi:hypothetical protein
MIVHVLAECQNTPEGQHHVTVQVNGWKDWTIIHSECTEKYGKMFGLMSKCSRITDFVEYNIILAIIHERTPEAFDIILDGIEAITPYEKRPFDNVWLLADVVKMLEEANEQHLKRILEIYTTKDFSHLADIKTMLNTVLKRISEQKPNPIIAKSIQEIIIQTGTVEDINSRILKHYPEYALETAKILFKQNKTYQTIDLLKDTNTYRTPEGYKILKSLAQMGYYEAIGLCMIIVNTMPEITEDS